MAKPGAHWPRLLTPQFMPAARARLADDEKAAATTVGEERSGGRLEWIRKDNSGDLIRGFLIIKYGTFRREAPALAKGI
jgi:hypothetical protein